jgi:hypothetical protein
MIGEKMDRPLDSSHSSIIYADIDEGRQKAGRKSKFETPIQGQSFGTNAFYRVCKWIVMKFSICFQPG